MWSRYRPRPSTAWRRDATNGEAVARIFEAKGRPRFNPLIAHVDSMEMAESLSRVRSRLASPRGGLLAGPADPGAAAPAGQPDTPAGDRRPRQRGTAHAARLWRRTHRPLRPAARRAQRQSLGPHQHHDRAGRRGRPRRPHRPCRRRRRDGRRRRNRPFSRSTGMACICCAPAASPSRNWRRSPECRSSAPPAGPSRRPA